MKNKETNNKVDQLGEVMNFCTKFITVLITSYTIRLYNLKNNNKHEKFVNKRGLLNN